MADNNNDGGQGAIDMAQQADDTSLVSFVSSIWTNLIIMVVVFLVFAVASKKIGWVYRPRVVCPNSSERRAKPPNFNMLNLAWVYDLMRMPWEDIVPIVGVDAALYLRFFHVGIKFFAVTTVLGCTLLIPVNITNYDQGERSANFKMADLTIQNVAEGSGYLWSHVFVAYVSAVYLLYLLYKEYVAYVDMRHRYFLSNREEALRVEQMSVLLVDIPDDIKTDDDLDRYIRSRFDNGDVVANAILVKRSEDLAKLHDERADVVAQIEDAVAKLCRKADERKEEGTKTKRLKISEEELNDSIAKLRVKLDDLNEKIRSKQAESHDAYRTGFATFKTFAATATASQLPWTHEVLSMEAHVAPEPRDLYWPNLHLTRRARVIRQLVAAALFLLLFTTYTVPVAFITSITSLENLQAQFPMLAGYLEANPAVRGQLQGFLPGLAMIIFMAVLPPLLRFFATIKGVVSHSAIDRNVFIYYFYFQFVHFFLFACLTQGVMGLVKDKSLSDMNLDFLLQSLAKAVSTQANPFLIQIMTRSFTTVPLELLVISKLLLGSLKMTRARTARDVRDVTYAGTFAYGEYYPVYLMLFLYGIIYAPIAPLILPFCLALCVTCAVVYRYMFCFVYAHESESGGALFPHVFRRVVFGLGFAQVVLIALLIGKNCPQMCVAVLPLLGFTTWYYFFMERNFGSRAERLSLEEIRALDRYLVQASRRITLGDATALDHIRRPGHSAYKPVWEVEHDVDIDRIKDVAVRAHPLVVQMHHDPKVLHRLVSREFELLPGASNVRLSRIDETEDSERAGVDERRSSPPRLAWSSDNIAGEAPV
ncbi:unnamed protein product (mitochondrion) [Plasmodiophora brassicae]|uniref:CSC1/OSCA1-like 7TM region domain-containing protein n=1 Tax=Plasmodiophora brassicae TaxID=37360 RepID=A0A0G4IRL6_PLABS|nr:hypothetical protein PBRA_006133 [Plasmodiophora brassicae]SPQ96158.1 unnamed protein product [Plasmodiophora brassicae]